ncbi:MAG: hypothetical protein ACLT8E_00670 [Akkermansia sp.]
MFASPFSGTLPARWRGELAESLLENPAVDPCAEEVMLDGMLIALARMEPEERLEQVARFVPA